MLADPTLAIYGQHQMESPKPVTYCPRGQGEEVRFYVFTNHGRVVGVESLIEVVHLDGNADDEVGDTNVGEAIGELVDWAGDGVDQSDADSFNGHHTQASNQRALKRRIVEMF